MKPSWGCVCLAVFVGACGGATTDQGSVAGEDGGTEGIVVGLGERCEGFTRSEDRQVCRRGLVCCYEEGAPDDVGGRCAEDTPGGCEEAATKAAKLVESCDGLDDDLDGHVDQGDVCARACGVDALALAAQTLRLPSAASNTVAEGSGITPQLTAMTTMPSFCSAPEPSADPEDVTVVCGQVMSFEGGKLHAKNLRIAPGGVLRVAGKTFLHAAEILVCPGGSIQAGGDPSRDADGQPGNELAISADTFVLLGTLSGSGGFTLARDKLGGDGAPLDIHVSRLLFAGLIDTAAPGPKGAQSGRGGVLGVFADDESFFSGTVRSGEAIMRMPVCCH